MISLACRRVFWGMQDLIRKRAGVVSTRVGYTGGEAPNPTYELLKTGASGHAESIEIAFDNTVVSFREIWPCFPNPRSNHYRPPRK